MNIADMQNNVETEMEKASWWQFFIFRYVLTLFPKLDVLIVTCSYKSPDTMLLEKIKYSSTLAYMVGLLLKN